MPTDEDMGYAIPRPATISDNPLASKAIKARIRKTFELYPEAVEAMAKSRMRQVLRWGDDDKAMDIRWDEADEVLRQAYMEAAADLLSSALPHLPLED